jgi:hypothetical protein
MPWIRVCSALALTASALAIAPSSAQTGPASARWATAVAEVALAVNATLAERLAALNDMRAIMKRQPGYWLEEFLQNLNAGKLPRSVPVPRWTSMTSRAALFRSPELCKPSAHANEH